MNKQYIKNKIIEIIEQNGIDLRNEKYYDEISSVVYVLILCCIEEEFCIHIPDEMLAANVLKDIDCLSEYIWLNKEKLLEK